MKAIKINAPVNLTSGSIIPSGAIVIIATGTADIKSAKDDKIPCQVATFVYNSLASYDAGKANVDASSIADFSPNFYGLQLAVVSYETLPTQDLLIGAVQVYLETIYPGQTTVINYTTYVVPPIVPIP